MGTTQEQLFLQAYEDYADDIYRHCCFRVGDKEIARDLTQDTFLRSWGYLVEGKTVDNLRAFFYKVANNLIIDWYRKNKPVSLDALAEQGVELADKEAEKFYTQREAHEAMMLVADLEPHYREVVRLRYVDDLSIKEIAEIVGETENSVSVRLHRGTKKLRQLLGVDNNREQKPKHDGRKD